MFVSFFEVLNCFTRMIIRSDDHPIHVTARASDFHPKHNLYCILEENYPNIEPFKEGIPFLKESKICKALTEKHKCYESHVRTFWSSARYDEKDETIYSVVKIKDDKKDIDLEVKITLGDVRRVPYKFLVHCVIHALSHRKGAYDETSDSIMNIIACLVLNRPYNILQVIFNHMVDIIKGEKFIMYPRFIQMLLDDQIPNQPKDELKLHHMDSETVKSFDKYKGVKPENEPRYRPKFGKIKKANYVAPEGDNWRHEESNSDSEIKRLESVVEKRLRFWFAKDEKKRKRTPKISLKVVIKETEKRKSPPRLVAEVVVPPTELIKQGAYILNMSFAEYLKCTTAKGAEGDNAEKEVETTTENVETTTKNVEVGGEGVKETFVEGLVHTDSSATESDEFDPTKIAPTSYISGKQKYKRSPKKKESV
ncbi:hypothetical protein Hanom_Chr13g01210491 [Helianthus anomalus]